MSERAERHTINVGTQTATCCAEHTMPFVECSCGWAPKCYPGMDSGSAIVAHQQDVVERALGLKIVVQGVPHRSGYKSGGELKRR